MQNLFELSPEEKERWLKDLADLMGVWEDWRLLASFRDQLLPLRGGQGATPAGGGASAEVPPDHRHQPGALRADGQGGRRSVARPKRRRR
jgi:hypothetical protein